MIELLLFHCAAFPLPFLFHSHYVVLPFCTTPLRFFSLSVPLDCCSSHYDDNMIVPALLIKVRGAIWGFWGQNGCQKRTPRVQLCSKNIKLFKKQTIAPNKSVILVRQIAPNHFCFDLLYLKTDVRIDSLVSNYIFKKISKFRTFCWGKCFDQNRISTFLFKQIRPA